MLKIFFTQGAILSNTSLVTYSGTEVREQNRLPPEESETFIRTVVVVNWFRIRTQFESLNVKRFTQCLRKRHRFPCFLREVKKSYIFSIFVEGVYILLNTSDHCLSVLEHDHSPEEYLAMKQKRTISSLVCSILSMIDYEFDRLTSIFSLPRNFHTTWRINTLLDIDH